VGLGYDRRAHPMAATTPPALRRRVAVAAVALATLAGGALRFYGLGTPSLWLDEMIMYDVATRAEHNPWHAWITGFEFENGPLYIASPLVGIAATLAGGSVAGVAAAWLFAVAPFNVYYSREGRPYAILALLATLALLAFLARRRRTSLWLGAAVALAAPYLAVSAFQVLAGTILTAGLCALAGLRARPGPGDRPPLPPFPPLPPETDRRRWPRLAATGLAGLALYALLYGRYPRGPQIGHIPPRHGQLLLDLLNTYAARALWRVGGFSDLTWVYAAAALAGLVFLLVRDRVRAAALAGMTVAITGLTWLGLQLSDHFFTLRYFSPALPPYLVLAGVGIAALARGVAWTIGRLQRAPASWWVAPALGAAGALALVAANAGNAPAVPYEKADWRGAARFIAVHSRPGEPVLATNSWTRTCLDFYLRPQPRLGPIQEVQGAVADADTLAARSAPCWIARGGYPMRGDLRRWARRFSPAWSSRMESIGVFHDP